MCTEKVITPNDLVKAVALTAFEGAPSSITIETANNLSLANPSGSHRHAPLQGAVTLGGASRACPYCQASDNPLPVAGLGLLPSECDEECDEGLKALLSTWQVRNVTLVAQALARMGITTQDSFMVFLHPGQYTPSCLRVQIQANILMELEAWLSAEAVTPADRALIRHHCGKMHAEFAEMAAMQQGVYCAAQETQPMMLQQVVEDSTCGNLPSQGVRDIGAQQVMEVVSLTEFGEEEVAMESWPSKPLLDVERVSTPTSKMAPSRTNEMNRFSSMRAPMGGA